MKKQLWILTFGLFVSSAAVAQDYGLAIGVHQTSATVDLSGDPAYTGVTGSAGSSLGFDLGFLASFELMPGFRFRTGALYNARPFEFKITAPIAGTAKFNYAYIDVPVNVQYNFTEQFGLFGGMIVGIKASDKVDLPAGSPSADLGMKSMYPLFNIGGNFTFDDMIGFDLYYEMGMGSFNDVAKNYSNFGMHFIYWL